MDRGFTPKEIGGILSLSDRLVGSYLEIVEEHHPNLLDGNSHSLKGHKS